MVPGDLVPLAGPGARVPALPAALTAREIRGVVSEGMLCSPMELGIAPTHEGILLLGDDLAPGDDLKTSLGLDDAVLDIEVTPNRADFLSVIGVAREVAAATGVPFHAPPTDVIEDDEPSEGVATVEVMDPDRCSHYLARILRDVRHTSVAHPRPGAPDRGGHASHLGRRRRDELRHARDRAAAAPVRPGVAEGSGDRGASSERGRADGHAGRRRAILHRGRSVDLRRGASGGRRGHHGRGSRRDLRHHRPGPAGGRVVRAWRDPADAAADRALHRGLHAVRAGRRSGGRVGRRRSRVPPHGGMVRRPRARRRGRGGRRAAAEERDHAREPGDEADRLRRLAGRRDGGLRPPDDAGRRRRATT